MSYEQQGAEDRPAPKPKANPFGAARPREQVIAEREGKRETEVLQEQVQKEWKPTSTLTEAQLEEKKALEGELAYAKNELLRASDPSRIQELKEEVAAKTKKLDELLLSFERMAVKPMRRERRKDDTAAPYPDAQEYSSFNRGGRGSRDPQYPDSQDYGSFSRARPERGAYGSAWSGSRSRDCYNCGQPGHISRECPNGGTGGGGGGGSRGYGGATSYSSFGGRAGGGGGGRDCYVCHEEGHLARDCPKGGSGGGGGYGGYHDAGGYGSGGGGGGGYGNEGGRSQGYDYPAGR